MSTKPKLPTSLSTLEKTLKASLRLSPVQKNNLFSALGMETDQDETDKDEIRQNSIVQRKFLQDLERTFQQFKADRLILDDPCNRASSKREVIKQIKFHARALLIALEQYGEELPHVRFRYIQRRLRPFDPLHKLLRNLLNISASVRKRSREEPIQDRWIPPTDMIWLSSLVLRGLLIALEEAENRLKGISSIGRRTNKATANAVVALCHLFDEHNPIVPPSADDKLADWDRLNGKIEFTKSALTAFGPTLNSTLIAKIKAAAKDQQYSGI